MVIMENQNLFEIFPSEHEFHMKRERTYLKGMVFIYRFRVDPCVAVALPRHTENRYTCD